MESLLIFATGIFWNQAYGKTLQKAGNWSSKKGRSNARAGVVDNEFCIFNRRHQSKRGFGTY